MTTLVNSTIKEAHNFTAGTIKGYYWILCKQHFVGITRASCGRLNMADSVLIR